MIGFLFDLDGTLIEMTLDFKAIRCELGVPTSAGSVLEYIRSAGEDAPRLLTLLNAHESHAAVTALPKDGSVQFLTYLKDHNVPRAIITRNSRESALVVVERLGLDVDVIIGREDAEPKPSAEPVLLAARLLGLPLDSLIMVGDHAYDIECGRRAGVRTVFLLGTHPSPGTADHEVNSLTELIPLVERELQDSRGPGKKN